MLRVSDHLESLRVILLNLLTKVRSSRQRESYADQSGTRDGYLSHKAWITSQTALMVVWILDQYYRQCHLCDCFRWNHGHDERGHR